MRDEPDLRPVGWALAAMAFVGWLALRVTYVIAAVIAILAAGSIPGFVFGEPWIGLVVMLVLVAFFITLAWLASRGPRPRDES